jgi:hypothetical protein
MGARMMFDLNSTPLAFAAFFFAAATIVTPASSQTFEPPTAKEGHSYSKPYCSNRGHRVEMGDLSCLKVDGRIFLARCSQSLNNPVWRMVQDSCPPEYDTLGDQNAATSSSSQPGNN